MKKYKYISILLLVSVPMVSFAALGGLKDLISALGGIINSIIPIMFGLALIYFFWGVIKFISNAGEEKAREEGRQKMLWGIIALFVFTSIFGILKWVGNTVGIEQGGFMDLINGGNSGGGTGGACIDGINPVDGSPC